MATSPTPPRNGNGNGNGSSDDSDRGFDKDAFKKSVQVVPPGEGPFSVSDSFVVYLAQTMDEIEPWGRNVKLRDTQLRDFSMNEPIFASSLATVCARNAGMPWKIEGPEKAAEDAQKLLQTANFGMGWQDFSLKLSRDLYTQDNGGFIEIIRDGKSADAEVIGIANLDSARCYHTGHPDIPVLYLDRNNKYHWLSWYQVITVAEMPAPHEGLRGLQYSAITRLFRAVKTQRDIGIYLSEKIGGRNPRAIHLVKGVSASDVLEAWQKVGFTNDAAGLTRFSNPVIVSALAPDAPIGFETLEIASTPDGFDMAEHWKQYIAQIAMAFLSDYQEFAPLPGGGLGTASQSETQHKKSSRTGIALYRGAIEHFLNWRVFPEEIEMSFEEPDLDAEQAEALARKTRAEERKLRIESTEITAAIARMRALASDDLTQEEFDEAEKEAEEQAKLQEEQAKEQMEALAQGQQQQLPPGQQKPPQPGAKPPSNPSAGGGAKPPRTAPIGEEQRGKAIGVSRSRNAVEAKVEEAVSSAFDDLWSVLLERTGSEEPGEDTEKFVESDWSRNSGRFAAYVGQGPGGGGGGASAGAALDAIASGQEARLDPRNTRDFVEMAAESEPHNLSLLQVAGEGNQNLFREHAKELSREEMPQLPTNSAGRQDFSVYLAMNGLSFTEGTVDPRTLKATQKELDSRKVAQIAKRASSEGLSDNAIFTSRNGEVLDGHHRWAAVSLNAVTNPGTTITEIRVDADIDTLLRVSRGFMEAKGIAPRTFGTETGGRKAMMTSPHGSFGETPLIPPPDASKPYMWLNGRWLEIMQDDPEDYLPLAVSEKFVESDWVRNSGRFADYLGKRGGGGGAGGAGEERVEAAQNAMARGSATRAGTTLEEWNVDAQAGKVHPDTQTLYLKNGKYPRDRQAIHNKALKEVTNGVPIHPEGERTYFVLGGGGGSGKTTLRNAGVIPVPKAKEAVSVNADDNKARLPEYKTMQKVGNKSAAAVVHEESSDMTQQQRKAGLDQGSHVVLDGVGDGKVEGLVKKASEAREKGYAVEGHYINIPTQDAVDRAETRFRDPDDPSYGRYVPEGRLRADHREVSRNFEAALEAGAFDRVAVYDSVGTAKAPKANMIFEATWTAEGGAKRTVHDPVAYQRFLDKGNEDVDIRTIKSLLFDLTDGRIMVEKEANRVAEKAKKPWVDLDPEDDQRLYMGAMRGTWPEGVPDTPDHRDRFDFWRRDYEQALEIIERSGVPGTVSITSDYDVSL